MSNKIILELRPEQVEHLVEELPIEEKLRLVRKLDDETLNIRMDEILKNIDKRRRKHPISSKEIDKIVKGVRKELYAQRYRRY